MVTQNPAKPREDEQSNIQLDINKVPVIIKIDRPALTNAVGIVLFLFLIGIWGLLFTHLNTIEQSAKQTNQQLSDIMAIVAKDAANRESPATPAPASSGTQSTPTSGTQSSASPQSSALPSSHTDQGMTLPGSSPQGD